MIEFNHHLTKSREQWFRDKINAYLERWGHDKDTDLLIDNLEWWFGIKI